MGKLRIATWNVGQDLENNEISYLSYERIKSEIINNNIDIICFQEAITESEKLEHLSNYISKNTDLKYCEEISLSPSDVNLNDKMGVAICSKYKINNNEKFVLENPNLIYEKTKDITYWSHDKGFNISRIDKLDITVIEGHCLPFHIFGKSPEEYKHIYSKLEEKVLEKIEQDKKVIFLGDFNYENIFKLFPKLKDKMKLTYEKQKTRKDKQFDNILITNNIENISYEIIDARFDHTLCIVELEIK